MITLYASPLTFPSSSVASTSFKSWRDVVAVIGLALMAYAATAATAATSANSANAAIASTAHPCASDALARAAKLLALQAESDQPGTIGKSVTALKAIRNPANSKQKFDVLAVTAFVYKAEYRMRFL